MRFSLSYFLHFPNTLLDLFYEKNKANATKKNINLLRGDSLSSTVSFIFFMVNLGFPSEKNKNNILFIEKRENLEETRGVCYGK